MLFLHGCCGSDFSSEEDEEVEADEEDGSSEEFTDSIEEDDNSSIQVKPNFSLYKNCVSFLFIKTTK